MATDADAQAYIDKIETDSGETVSASYDSNIDTLVQGLKTDGIWSKLDFLYLHKRTPYREGVIINMIDATAQGSENGSLTWSETAGLTGNGSTGYFNPGFTPSVDGVNFTQNDASFGFRISDALNGVWGNDNVKITAFDADTIITKLNQSSDEFTTIADPLDGFLGLCRASSTNVRIFSDGSLQENAAETSSALSSEQILFLAKDSGGGPSDFSTNTMEFGYAGANLTDAEMADFNSRMNTYFASSFAGETTPPTLPEGGALTKANIDQNSFDLEFNDAEDETSTDANLTYKMFISGSNDLNTDVATVEANGTEVASDTGANITSGATLTLNSGDISAQGYNPGDNLWAVIVAYDEAGNGVIYTQVEITLQRIFGNVDLSGTNKQFVDVIISTLDDPVTPTTQTPVEIAVTDISGDFIMSTEYDRTLCYLLSYLLMEEATDSGTAESGTTTTLTDTDKSWTPDEYIDANQPYYLVCTGGTNAGYVGRITDNDEDTLTLRSVAASAFDATSQYEIVQSYVQTQIIEPLEY